MHAANVAITTSAHLAFEFKLYYSCYKVVIYYSGNNNEVLCVAVTLIPWNIDFGFMQIGCVLGCWELREVGDGVPYDIWKCLIED